MTTRRSRASAVWARTRGRCWYCGESLTLADCTIDHLVPRRLGGTNALDNLVPACVACNSAKGHHDLETLRLVLTSRTDPGPTFTRPQLEWLRDRGIDPYPEKIRFWFETEGLVS